MRHPFIFVGLLIAAIALLFIVYSNEDSGLPDISAQENVADEPEEAAVDLQDLLLDGGADKLREAAPEPIVDAGEPEKADGADCTVIGRVVDGNDAPLEGVSVRLAGYKVWADGLDLPRLAGRYDFRGWEMKTDANGDFRFETPLPTVERTKLTITPDIFHNSASMWFGEGNSRSKPALKSGLRDLGVIKLEGTGALSGRVVDEHGAPIAGVKMGIGPSANTTYSRNAWTDESGNYLIGHAPLGTYGASALITGYLLQFKEPVEVALGQETTGVDFVLVASPTIEGYVVDPQGQPIKGVRISGWPAGGGGGRAASARSEEDGSFVLPLPQVQPVSMSARLDGYATWGDDHDRSVVHEPGTRNLRIVLEPLPATRFLAIDDTTGQPLLSYGLNILENNGSEYKGSMHTERRRPRSEDHPDGIAEATAREGIDLYVIGAEGYLLATGDVQHDQPGGGLQTVRLRKGSGLSGRVMHDGAALAGAKVHIESGFMMSGGLFDAMLDAGVRTADIPTTWQATYGSQQSALTDADGRFIFIGLNPGTYRINASAGAKGNAPRKQVDLGGEPVNVGDLVLSPGVIVKGTILLPANMEAEGLDVYMDGSRHGRKAFSNSAGEFEFTGVAAGAHTLSVGERPGELAGTTPINVEVGTDPLLNVTLDARDRAMCEVSLLIDLDGVETKGTLVYLETLGETMERSRLGVCDEEGRVHGHVRAWGDAAIEVWKPGAAMMRHPSARLHLVPGGELDQVVEFEFTSLSITLPPSIQFPDVGRASLTLKCADPNREDLERTFQIKNGELRAVSSKMASIDSRTLQVSGLFAGRYTLTFELLESTIHADFPTDHDKFTSITVTDGDIMTDLPPYFTRTQEVALKVGEALQLQLP